jgi:hypothetical protein
MSKQLTRPLQLALKYWGELTDNLELSLYSGHTLIMSFKKALGLGLVAVATNGIDATVDCSSLLVDTKSLIPGLQPYSAQS